jgi:hypothetical protein
VDIGVKGKVEGGFWLRLKVTWSDMTVPLSRKVSWDMHYLPRRTVRVLAIVSLDEVGYTDGML